MTIKKRRYRPSNPIILSPLSFIPSHQGMIMIHFDLNYGSLTGGERIPASRIERLFRLAERVLKLSGKRYVSIAFVGATAMKRLNESYYGGEGVTDVLAFPAEGLSEAHGSLGEILVYYPRAKRQAQARGASTRSEVELLVVHGLLHLLGYDHDTPRKKAHMFRLQEHILQ